MRKPKKPKGTLAALAEASRTQAETAPPTFGPVTVEFDPEYEEIQGVWYSRKQVCDAVIAQMKKSKPRGRPKGKTSRTVAKLERIARLQRDGLSLSAISKSLKMDYGALRKFLSKNRADFDRLLIRP